MSEFEKAASELTRRRALGLAASVVIGAAALRPNFSLAREPELGDDHGSGGHGADDPPGDDHGGVLGDDTDDGADGDSGDSGDSDDDSSGPGSSGPGGSGSNDSGRHRRRRRGHRS
ncbi:MAG TPA: hypothetical protein VFQ80_11080 [Thermomicrobiales bacterium]|nr:hypothetical protein [Thermomicrobiales bacterium]